jgi:hypothetical protein
MYVCVNSTLMKYSSEGPSPLSAPMSLTAHVSHPLLQKKSSKRRRPEPLSGFRVPSFFFADKDIPHGEKMAIVQSATEAILDGSARGWSYFIPMITRPSGAESITFHLELDNGSNWYLGRRYVCTYVLDETKIESWPSIRTRCE